MHLPVSYITLNPRPSLPLRSHLNKLNSPPFPLSPSKPPLSKPKPQRTHSSPTPSVMETPGLVSLLQHTTEDRRTKLSGRGIFWMFKLFPMLTSGCKMVAHLGRPRKGSLSDQATTITLFGCKRGRVSLAIQEDPRSLTTFLIELPMLASSLHEEMASGLVKIALESEARTHKKKLIEEYVWAVHCNGRKSGYSIRRKETSDDRQVMQLLRGVSMGAGVLPCDMETAEGEMTYFRAQLERVVGSKDSEALYMINPDGTGRPELSIFLVRVE